MRINYGKIYLISSIIIVCMVIYFAGYQHGHDTGYQKGAEHTQTLVRIAETAIIKAKLVFFITELKDYEIEGELLKKSILHSVKFALKAMPSENSQQSIENLAVIIEQATEWKLTSWEGLGYKDKNDFIKHWDKLKKETVELICKFQDAIEKIQNYPEIYSDDDYQKLGGLIQKAVDWGIINWDELGYPTEEQYLKDFLLYGYAMY